MRWIERLSGWTKAARGYIVWGAAAGALFVFGKLTFEFLLERRSLDAFDNSVVLWLARQRRPWLNGVAVDITALGSVTDIVLFTLVGLLALQIAKDRRGQLQLTLAMSGALLWMTLSKNLIERARPSSVPHLVVVRGFSYPSGHSTGAAALYMTLAMMAFRHAAGYRARAAILAATLVLTTLVGLSRMYLGVHYPSDVASGVMLGFAWALILTGILAAQEKTVRLGR